MSTQQLEWLPDVLEQAGLKVATVDGWKERGRPGSFGPVNPYLTPPFQI